MKRCLPLLLALLLPAIARAGLPDGYAFSAVGDAIPLQADYRQQFADQQLSIATATNNNGLLYGFRVTGDGMVRGFNIAFGSNPQMTAVDSEHFIALSAADVTCWWIFCNTEYPFGVRIVEDAESGVRGAVTAFLNTPTDGTALPGSLPFLAYPGNFVDENRRGVVASTQVSAEAQFGVLFHTGGVTQLDDVPWLVAINDLEQPLVLAYGGADGPCQVFGEDCAPPPPQECVDDPNPGKGGGNESRGKGHAWGHNKCRDGAEDGNNGGGNDGRGGDSGAVIGNGNGALLIRLLPDGSTLRYRFPASVVAGDALRATANVFPLALNDNTAVLRGDVLNGDTVLDKRLLACRFDPASPDTDADGVVDCQGGLRLLGGTAGSVRAGTVLGFALNNAGVLAGNLGFSAAGIGYPFLLDINADAPRAEPLANLATGADDWEINVLTDLNQSGKLVGYGYRNCAAQPEAFFLNATAGGTAGGLRFARGNFEFPALLPAGTPLAVQPTVLGGSGDYEWRVERRTPADSEWQLHSDWSADVPAVDPGDHRGDLCLRIAVRDAQSPALQRQTVVRYFVGSETAGDGDDDSDVIDSDEESGRANPVALRPTGRFSFADLVGAGGGWLLLAMAALVIRRRR